MYIIIYTYYAYTHLNPPKRIIHHCKHTSLNALQPSPTWKNCQNSTPNSKWIFLSGIRWPLVDPSMLTPKTISHFFATRVTNSKVMWDEPRWIQHQHSWGRSRWSHLEGCGGNAKVDGWNKWMDWNGFLNVQFFFLLKYSFPKILGEFLDDCKVFFGLKRQLLNGRYNFTT